MNADLSERTGSPTIRPSQLLWLCWRHAGLIALCALITALVGYGFAKMQTPRYSASGTIALEGQSFAIPELQGAIRNDNMPDPMPTVRTEEQALTSRQLIRSVISELGINSLPEWNPALRPPSLVEKVKDIFRTAVQFVLGSQQVADVADAPSQLVEGEVMRALVITQDNRSLVIGVGFTSQNPELAARFVNTLVADYVALRAQRRIAANEDANAAMLQRVDDVRADINKLEQQIRDLRTKGEVVGLRAGSLGQQQLEDLAAAASKASVERAEIEAQWQRARVLSQRGSSDDLNTVLNSPTIAALRAQETQASQRLADLSSRYGPSYPAVLSAQANLAATRGQLAQETQRIVASLASQLSVARAHEADTLKQLSEARLNGVKSENAQAELADLQHELAARRELYGSLLRGAQQTLTQPNNTPTLDVRVLSSAVPPAYPSSPNTKFAAAMGVNRVCQGKGRCGGIFFGVFLSFIRDRRADVFTTVEEVTAVTGLPVLAVVPCRDGGPSLVSQIIQEPRGEVAEAFRFLRARLRNESRLGAPRSVLFAADNDDPGSAEIAACFAYVAARDGERVILVEGNVNEPQLAGLLGIAKADMLAVLEGERDWRHALLNEQSAGLDLLVTSAPIADSHALLVNPRFQNLLVDLRAAYNLIVLNAAPAKSADTFALALRTDATVLVIDASTAKQTRVREAATRLSTIAKSPLVAMMTMPA
jgi:succinoglycan biosynthesis transport protein ExoP